MGGEDESFLTPETTLRDMPPLKTEEEAAKKRGINTAEMQEIYGYDKYGCDKDGFNRAGYDKSGLSKDGFDRYGFDRYGFDRRV